MTTLYEQETYSAEYGDNARKHDPWLMILPCKLGHIYPWGGSTLAASTDKAGPAAKRLKRLSCTTVYQDGNDGVTVLFDVADYKDVFRIVKPRLRRRMSPEQREAAIARLRTYHQTAA